MNRKHRRQLRQAVFRRVSAFVNPVTDSEPPQSDLDYWDGCDNRKYEYERKQWANAMDHLDAGVKKIGGTSRCRAVAA